MEANHWRHASNVVAFRRSSCRSFGRKCQDLRCKNFYRSLNETHSKFEVDFHPNLKINSNEFCAVLWALRSVLLTFYLFRISIRFCLFSGWFYSLDGIINLSSPGAQHPDICRSNKHHLIIKSRHDTSFKIWNIYPPSCRRDGAVDTHVCMINSRLISAIIGHKADHINVHLITYFRARCLFNFRSRISITHKFCFNNINKYLINLW